MADIQGDMLYWTGSTIMATDGSALTWRRDICAHNDVLYFPCIYGTCTIRVKAQLYGGHTWQTSNE